MSLRKLSAAVQGFARVILTISICQALVAKAHASSATVFDIPKLQNINIDGDASDWADAINGGDNGGGNGGFHVDCLADAGDEHPAGFESRFRLAWDDRGLLALFIVTDPTPFEGPDLKLSSGDSVELMLSNKLGGDDSVQLFVAPGRTKTNPIIRKHQIDNRRTEALKKLPLTSMVTRQITAKGYIVQMLIPWGNLAIDAKPGQTVAVQACVNDAQSPDAEFQSAWFPANGTGRTENAFTVRLSDHASPPVKVAGWGGYKRYRSNIRITAAADTGGDFLATLSNGDAVHGTLLRQGDHWAGIAQLPLPAETDADPTVQVTVGASATPPLHPGKVKAHPHEAFMKQPVVFETTVFSDTKFPACDFKSPELIEALIGPYSLHTRFFNQQFEEVARADHPGRYGAVVEIRDQTGETYRQLITLFRSAHAVNWRHSMGANATTLPSETGIDPAVASRQLPVLTDFADWQLADGMRHSTDSAIWLNWLFTVKNDEPAGAAWTRSEHADMKWWADLKQKLGLPGYQFMVQKPPGYDDDPPRTFPTILFLSGVGERGDELKNLLATGLPKYVKAHPDFPFLVISPQCPEQEYWNPWELNALIDQVSQAYRIDPHRLYLTGLSMGGEGSWELASTFPNRFAAVAPIAGPGDPKEIVNLKDIPLWVFHGGKDNGIETENQCVAALQVLGSKVKYTVYPDGHHDVWTKTYANPDLYRWFLEQKK